MLYYGFRLEAPKEASRGHARARALTEEDDKADGTLEQLVNKIRERLSSRKGTPRCGNSGEYDSLQRYYKRAMKPLLEQQNKQQGRSKRLCPVERSHCSPVEEKATIVSRMTVVSEDWSVEEIVED